MNARQGENNDEVPTGNTDSWAVATRILHANNQMACQVLGGSMSPFLIHGDVVWLRKVKAPALKYGDIVLYVAHGQHIVHRYLGKKRVQGREILRIKGDAVAHDDPPVAESEVLAKVVIVCKGKLHIDLEGRAGRLLNITMALLSSCPGLLGTARAIWRLRNSWRPRVTSASNN